MNIAYIGGSDALASKIIDHLGKEENTIFLLSKKDIKKENKPKLKYHFYKRPEEEIMLQKKLRAISPDVIIYAGEEYLYEDIEEDSEISHFTAVLEEAGRQKLRHFILLSSTEVYGEIEGVINEETAVCPSTQKGRQMAVREKTLELYASSNHLNYAILRTGIIFGDSFSIGARDFWGKTCEQIKEGCPISEEKEWMQPVHILDLSEAIKRVITGGMKGVYHVVSGKSLNKSKVINLLRSYIKNEEIRVREEEKEPVQYFTNDKIKKDLEWSDFWSLEKKLQEKEIKILGQKDKKKKIGLVQNDRMSRARKLLEILVLFFVFGCLYVVTFDHKLFGEMVYLHIYVAIVTLIYGVRYGALGVLLAGVIYFHMEGNGFLFSDFHSYVDKILTIVEFLLFGIVIGYTTDMLKEKIAEKDLRIEELQNNITELEEINEKTVLIKKEYEKRVLEDKDSLSRLYTIIQRVNVLESGRITMEVINVIHELLDTDTVAIYRYNHRSPYLRLLDSLNENSLIGGRSFNISKYPRIESAVKKHEIYEGNVWENEPAMVMSVGISEEYSVVVVVKELKLENTSLHTVNIMRTIFALLGTSLQRALDYDNITKEQKYVEDTFILTKDEFKKSVIIAEEKKEKNMSEYCILGIYGDSDLVTTYRKVETLFREVDIFGVDENNHLKILLDNTGEEDVKHVMDRLSKADITVKREA